MSSAAYLTFPHGEDGVSFEDWQRFCQDFELVHSPRSFGGNVYYHKGPGGVECRFTEHAVVFSTFYTESHCPDVARLAVVAWRRWGGRLTADPEIRDVICHQEWKP